MADKIPCFAKVNIPDLAKLFDSKYKEGMSEAEQRQIGTDIALDYHKKLFEELNTFKEKDLKIKLTKEQKTYVSPDKSEAIKKITDDYQKQIDEANTPIPEPIKAEEKPQPEKTIVEDKQGAVGKYEEKARKIADKILKAELPDWAKADLPEGTKKAGGDFESIKKAIANATIEMGKLLDKGVEFSEAVKKAVKGIVDILGEGKRADIEKGFAEDYKKGVIDGEGIKVTHAATEEIRKEKGLGDYTKTPQTVEQWRTEAAERIKNGELPKLLAKMKRGEPITEVEQIMMGQHIANLNAEVDKNPTKENYDNLKEAIELDDKIGGTMWGASGRARQESFLPEDSIGVFLREKEAAQGTALTEEQLKTESAKYEELKKAKEAVDAELKEERERYQKLVAEVGVNKAKAAARKASKKTKEEHVADRKAIVEKAREALRKIRNDSSLKSTIPGFAELKALTPHIKSYMQDLLNEGVDKFDNIVSAIHAEFKDVLDTLRKTDVIDILAGDYDTKAEQTRNEKAASLRLAQREAKLLKELAAARKGEEKAKNQRDKTDANRRIDELKAKIKEVRRLNNEDVEVEIPTQEKLLSDFIDKMTKKAERLAKDIKEKNYLKEKPEQLIFKKSRKAQILEDRVIDLENKIRHERSVDKYRKRSKARRWFDKVMEVLGIRRLVQSAVDISVPFRQGATMLSPRKIDVWAKGFKANLQSVFSPKKFDRIMYEIRHDEMYHDMVKDNIVFNDLGSADPNLHNEDFRKSFVYNIPIISEPLKASNRSADAFLNVTRLELYKKMRAKLESQGLTREADPAAFKYIGNWAMSMTGRGRMTKMLENSAASTVLGYTFYGARLMASRFNILNPVTYLDPRIPKQAKVEAFKDLAAFTGTVMVTAIGLMAAGGKVSLDPDDSEFLQVRFGDKVYDLSGGLANYVRTFLRLVKAGHTKFTKSKYEGRQATDKSAKSLMMFFRNKLSPNTAYSVDAYFGKAYGQKFSADEIAAIYPMYSDDVIKALKEDGLISLATVLVPNLIGIGYGSYASKGQIDSKLEDLLERNLRSDEMNSEKIIDYNNGGKPVTFKQFNEYADKRDKKIEDDITILFEKGIGDKEYKDLTPDEVRAEIKYIKANATTEVKKEMFGKQKQTREERLKSEKLSRERKENYKKN